MGNELSSSLLYNILYFYIYLQKKDLYKNHKKSVLMVLMIHYVGLGSLGNMVYLAEYQCMLCLYIALGETTLMQYTFSTLSALFSTL